MMPAERTRCWRKAFRRTRRGIPARRRATHAAETAYGRGQRERDRDRLAAWQQETARAEMAAAIAARQESTT
jgi:hypothetical protein